MRPLTLVLMLAAAGGTAAAGENAAAAGKVVVGYYPSWNRTLLPHTAIQYVHVTHLFHAFIAPTNDGGIEVPAGYLYPELIQSAHAHGVKVLPSLGGWGDYSARFSPMTADTAARRRFVQQLTAFLLANGYDGADLDYEYPKNAADRSNFRSLISELRTAFTAVNPPLLLTMAGPSTNWSGQWFDFAGMKDDFDLIGIMTYDYYGSWTSKAGPNSAVYGNWAANTEGWMDYSVDYYSLTRGIPKEKLLVGIPFYGWQFSASTMYGTSTGASQLTYSSIAPKLSQGWVRSWDATGLVPYMVNGTGTLVISYDDTVSVAAKCSYLISKGVAGTIIWALGQDLVNGTQPLLGVVGAMLRTTGVEGPMTSADTPPEFRITQNYPNPFNAETRIEYRITTAGPVKLQIFDLLGREVAVPVDTWQAPGLYTVRFDATHLASGTYVYRLGAGKRTLSRTMTILR